MDTLQDSEQKTPRPVFIIGSPRSGTSVLTWAIGQHPNISLQPESNWMPTIAEAAFAAYRIGTARDEFSQISNANMPLDAFMAHFGNAIDSISRECYERRVESAHPGYRQQARIRENGDESGKTARLIRAPSEPKARWVDGTPEYSFHTYALGLMFPECKFIHILRRPDLVVNSLTHFENAGKDAHNFDVTSAIDTWMRYTLAAQETANFFGHSRVLRIDNSDLAEDGAAVLSRCFSFIGEPDCEHAVSALGTNMNSSKAAENQKRTRQQIEERSDFLKALALYEELRGSEVTANPVGKALAEQRRRFDQPSHPAVSVLKRLFR